MRKFSGLVKSRKGQIISGKHKLLPSGKREEGSQSALSDSLVIVRGFSIYSSKRVLQNRTLRKFIVTYNGMI